MRAARRLVLTAAAAVALGWTAAQGVAPTLASVGRPASDPTARGAFRASGSAVESEAALAIRAVTPASPSDLERLAPGGVASQHPGAVQALMVAADRHGPEDLAAGDPVAPHAGSSAPWPSLDPVARRPGAATATVEGHDPAAPRALVLWRIEYGRAAQLASARSSPDGRVSFGEVALPSGAFELAATPKGVRAAGARSARSTTIPPAERAAPRVEAQPDGVGTWRLRVRLETPGGWLVVSTLNDVEIGRAPVPLAASAARTGFDLWIDDVGTIGTVLLTHHDANAGRSAARQVALTAEDAEGERR